MPIKKAALWAALLLMLMDVSEFSLCDYPGSVT
jgi:hypothetical protein